MNNISEAFCWYETDAGDGQESEQLVDVGNRDSVLDFTQRFLESHALPRNIDEVHNVTATIARYKGPRLVRSATLESFVAGLVDPAH